MFKDGLIILCSVLILLIIQHCSIMEKKKKERFTKGNKRNRCTSTDSLETTCLIRSKYA